MIVIIVLTRSYNIHNLSLAVVNASFSVHALRCDDDMQRFIILWLTGSACTTILDASFSTDGNLAYVVLFKTLLGVAAWTKDKTDEIEGTFLFLRDVELIDKFRRAHASRRTKGRV